MAPIISLESIGKKYFVGHQVQRKGYTALREVLGDQVRGFAKYAGSWFTGERSTSSEDIEEFWALKDVSFDVHPGEVVGIIGRNGAGKSTLLKILSRITEPSTGRVTLRGRVASLLEVGTGFHPELTGRENIFLNGAILGMSRVEIKRKFDEIVDFAEVERFLDTPVKRYSSGMYVRLAFAVAAHLEPEILIVDEVLAVGDADFQKKCIGKMRDVSSSGRTVLLVSHNMASVASICQRAILMESGHVTGDGLPSDVILSHLSGSKDSSIERRTVGNEFGKLLDAWTENEAGQRTTTFYMDAPVRIVMDYQVCKEVSLAPFPNFHVHDERGQCAFISADRLDSAHTPGVYRAVCEVPGNLLNSGVYFIGVALTCTHSGLDVCFYDRDAITINVVEDQSGDIYGPPRFGYAGTYPGVVRPKLSWQVSPLHGVHDNAASTS